MSIFSGVNSECIAVIPQQLLELMVDNPLTGDLYISSLGYTVITNYSFHPTTSLDVEYIILYCTHGHGWLSFKEGMQQLSFNQYIIVDSNSLVNLRPDPNTPWTLYWVAFKGEKAKIYARGGGEPTDIPPSVESRIEQRLELFESIYNIVSAETLTIERLNYANILLAHYLATFHFVELFKQSKPRTQSTASTMVGRVTHYMSENIERSLTLDELANYAGYSPSYFYRKFVAEVGTPPLLYFTNMKISKASIHLIKSDMSIVQIAARMGFSSSEYFSRSFKRSLGISPKQFRKENFRI